MRGCRESLSHGDGQIGCLDLAYLASEIRFSGNAYQHPLGNGEDITLHRQSRNMAGDEFIDIDAHWP